MHLLEWNMLLTIFSTILSWTEFLMNTIPSGSKSKILYMQFYAAPVVKQSSIFSLSGSFCWCPWPCARKKSLSGKCKHLIQKGHQIFLQHQKNEQRPRSNNLVTEITITIMIISILLTLDEIIRVIELKQRGCTD